MAVLIFVVGIVLRGGLRWPAVDLFIAFVCAEFIALCVIAHFSGFTWLELFDAFNLKWLAAMTVFVGVPWLLGLATGSGVLKLRKRGEHGSA